MPAGVLDQTLRLLERLIASNRRLDLRGEILNTHAQAVEPEVGQQGQLFLARDAGIYFHGDL